MKPEHLEQICRYAEDKALAAVFDALRARIKDQWVNAKTPEDREDHWRDHRAIDRLQKEIGKLAAEARKP